jgi:alkylation response protein AidB-like acyl-CoA dehydrogenase
MAITEHGLGVSFGLSAEQRALRELAHDFAADEIRPREREHDEHMRHPDELISKAHELGLMNVHVPEEYGGAALSAFDGMLIGEELYWGCAGIGTSITANGLGSGPLILFGSDEQKATWLPPLIESPILCSFGLSEPGAGSDVASLKTTALRDGDEYVLNGSKTFITNGPYADVLVVYAKLDEGNPSPNKQDKRNRPVLVFVLDSGMPGLTQGKPFKKMGMMSSPTGELFFDNVRLSPDRLLGESERHDDGDGRDSARENFAAERIGIAMMALGIIDECHRLCVDYAKNRTLWGKNIGQFQLIQLKLAKMEIARMNVQNMVFQIIERQQAGKPLTLAEASAIKLYSSEAATDVAMDAVQLFGGNGYMAEYRVEQLARDAKSLMIYAGSNEVQVTHIAKGLLS